MMMAMLLQSNRLFLLRSQDWNAVRVFCVLRESARIFLNVFWGILFCFSQHDLFSCNMRKVAGADIWNHAEVKKLRYLSIVLALVQGSAGPSLQGSASACPSQYCMLLFT